MFRNRKEDEMLNDDSAPAQGSLLSNTMSSADESASSQSMGSPASSAASSASQQVSSYPAAPAAARSVSDPISRPQGPLPTALNPFRSPADAARRPEAKTAAAFGQPAASNAAERAERAKDSRRVLTVGSDILLKGEIATCDRLVIEGKVDAVLNDVGTVELAESGSFKGVAQVENAEISGLFEGELVVKGRLVIYASGRVRGKITYGEIEIERGGELTGDIKTITSATQTRGRSGDKFSMKDEKIAAA